MTASVVGRWCCLAAILLLLGIVLSPLRATAGTIPLVASVAAVAPTATTQAGAPVPVRERVEEARTATHDSAVVRYDPSINLPVTGAPRAAVRETQGYDDGLEHADGRELRCEGAIYDAPGVVPAAEGAQYADGSFSSIDWIGYPAGHAAPDHSPLTVVSRMEFSQCA